MSPHHDDLMFQRVICAATLTAGAAPTPTH